MELEQPNYGRNLYSLGCGIASWLGIQTQCDSRIEIQGERLILLLMDGFGWNIMERALGEVKEATKIHGVFPSTTSTTLTTLFTAKTPSQHGVLGYNTFVKSLGGIVNSLRYNHPSESQRDSLSNGMPFEKAFPNSKGYLWQVNEGTAAVLPAGIENTEFTKVVQGKVQETKTYLNVWDAYESLRSIIEKKYKFIYVYIPDVDSLAHKYGPYADPTLASAREIFMKFYSLLKDVKEYTTLITADHGLVETRGLVELDKDEELLSMLELPPYGDSRAVFLRTRYDMKTYIHGKYNLKVFTKEELFQILGGKGDQSALPDYGAVPLDYTAYIFNFREKSNYARLKGHHGGLFKEEIEVPLVTING
ncbi:PglZ domain-containing protein [Metallosphaera tengchongensis]|uniref:PglZ domain-containing protein n=1 Tax=Metallosphaera tengchongensis TaxID=1532350 RepID=A0A6N0NWE3_9CREN|nr:alkaline phosphatase family protein [Metallosphaera tengchongensis]QKR00527.1 PglZ domain-containing protein [Metallosphaera tengchongensis]